MKKILIWDARIPLQNIGGPSGYLYQIKKQLLETPNDSICFLSDFLKKQEKSLSGKHESLVNLAKSNKFLTFLKKIFNIYRHTHNPFSRCLINNIDLNEFTHIHFHVSLDYYNAKHLLKNYKGTIVLTSHSPEPISIEIANRTFAQKSIYYKWAVKSIKKAEDWAFKNATKIMFPVEDAIEPYMKDPKFREILNYRKSDILYCPTAILPKELNINYIENFRKKYNIPDNAFIISYIGRHNAVKGYDILKQIATQLFSNFNSIYFVVAGSKGPIEELKHKQWIEVGWTDKGNEIVAASDLFILPNRNTYFDLIALEVLRTGTPMLMSLTGGNKYFKKTYPSHPGISFFEIGKTEQAIECISRFIKMKETEGLAGCIESNIKIWKSDFTLPKYINHYLEII